MLRIKKILKSKPVIIYGLRAISTSNGRKRIEKLKKIGKEQREGEIK